MIHLPDQYWARLGEARQVLRRWSPTRTVPEILVSSLSTLHGELPSGIYCMSDYGRGTEALGVTSELPMDRLLATPFIQTNLLFSRTFANVFEAESLWGAENRAIMGDDLRSDPYRWRIFNETLMSRLGFRDNLRIIFTTADTWLGWCGSFTTGARNFTESDRALLDLFSEDMLDVVLAWHELAPAFGSQHSMLQAATGWSEPVFAYTGAGHFLFANDTARLTLAEPPEWLPAALANGTHIADGWDRIGLPFARGTIVFFWERREGPEVGRLDAAVVSRLQLLPHLRQIAFHLLQGSTNKEIAACLEKPVRTVDSYVGKVLKHTGVRTRAEFVHRATQLAFVARKPWPLHFHR